jgi:hypothetical protein
MVHSAASERDATATGVSDRNRALCIAIIIELGKQKWHSVRPARPVARVCTTRVTRTICAICAMFLNMMLYKIYVSFFSLTVGFFLLCLLPGLFFRFTSLSLSCSTRPSSRLCRIRLLNALLFFFGGETLISPSFGGFARITSSIALTGLKLTTLS